MGQTNIAERSQWYEIAVILPTEGFLTGDSHGDMKFPDSGGEAQITSALRTAARG